MTDRRSISPPSLRELPSLSRSSTANTIQTLNGGASLSSSRSSSLAPSLRSSTPSSMSSATDDQIIIIDDTQNASVAYQKASMRPQLKTHQLSFQGEQQPSKKVRMTNNASAGGMGSVMARIFNTATGRGQNVQLPSQVSNLSAYHYQQQHIAA